MNYLLLLLSLLSLSLFSFSSCSKDRDDDQPGLTCEQRGYYQPKEIVNYDNAFFDLRANYRQYNNSSYIRVDMDSIHHQATSTLDEHKGSLYRPVDHRFVYRDIDLEELFTNGSCGIDLVHYRQERGDGILNDTFYWNTPNETYKIPLDMKAAIPPADTIMFPSPSGAMYYWSGEPLGVDERVRLTITTYVDDSTTWEFNYSTDLIGATGIHIPGYDLYDLTGFFSWVSISRHRNYEIGQPEIPYGSGHIRLDYYHEDVVLGVW